MTRVIEDSGWVTLSYCHVLMSITLQLKRGSGRKAASDLHHDGFD